MNETPWTYRRDGQASRGLPKIRVRVNSPATAVAAAVEGLGLTRVLDFVIEQELRSGKLVPILVDYDGWSLAVHLIYVRQGLLPLKVRAFLDWMAPRLRQKLKERIEQDP